MNIISYLINFKTDISAKSGYYKERIYRMQTAQSAYPLHFHTERHAVCSSSEHAPISKICEGYQFSILFDGKLTNTQNLKSKLAAAGYTFLSDSDAEIALNCYIHCGENCPEILDGSYSFIIYDAMRRQIFAVSDFFSSRPLFFCVCKDEILITSKISGILSHPSVSAKLSANSLRELLSFPTDCSGNIFDGIFKIPPVHYLKIKNGVVSVNEYTLLPNTHLPLDIISKNLSHTDCKNILYSPSSAADLLYSKLSRESPTIYPLFRDDITSDLLKDGLKETVSACCLPIFSHYDFLLPYTLKYSENKTFVSAFPYDSAANTKINPQLIQRLVKPIADTLNLHDYISFSPNKFSAILPIASKYGCKIHFPFLAHGIYEQLSALPYNPELYFQNVSDLAIPTVHLFRQDCEKIRFLLRRRLLSVISDNSSSINAFFNPSSILLMCEGKFNLPHLTEIALCAYLLKLNIWFEEYRPSII